MDSKEYDQYITCVHDVNFYSDICSLYRKSYGEGSIGFTEGAFAFKVKTCLMSNGFSVDKVSEKVLKEIADYYVEEMPKYLELFSPPKSPEFVTETKSFIKHKAGTEEFLQKCKQINLSADKLINKSEFNMKYPNGFHTPTIYNNVDVSDLSKEDLMEAIRNEKAKIKSVEDLKESKTIQKEIKQAEDNISKLLDLLDKESGVGQVGH